RSLARSAHSPRSPLINELMTALNYLPQRTDDSVEFALYIAQVCKNLVYLVRLLVEKHIDDRANYVYGRAQPSLLRLTSRRNICAFAREDLMRRNAELDERGVRLFQQLTHQPAALPQFRIVAPIVVVFE